MSPEERKRLVEIMSEAHRNYEIVHWYRWRPIDGYNAMDHVLAAAEAAGYVITAPGDGR